MSVNLLRGNAIVKDVYFISDVVALVQNVVLLNSILKYFLKPALIAIIIHRKVNTNNHP